MDTLCHRSRPGRGACAAVATAALGVASLLLAALPAAASSSSDQLAVDEVSHSKNVNLVANIPKQAPIEDFNSDLAFKDHYAFGGNYDGFTVYDIAHPERPTVVSQVYCPGAQGDPSVTRNGNLLFLSVDTPREDDTCGSPRSSPTVESSFEGVRIFDISDVRHPRYIKAVKTDCGSHTHTLVPSKDGKSVYVYVSSYSPSTAFPHCQPPHDSISIIKADLDNPAGASVIATPNLFPDGGGSRTSGCHDITAYPEKDIAAGACMGDGILMNISDPANPRVIDRVQDSNFAFFHSATFSNDASKVVFTDELGGGGAPTCNEETGPTHGADAIFDIAGTGDHRRMAFRSYYKIPRMQKDTENCVAHNGSLIPVKGRDIMVQAWYQGGVSIWEFTDSSNPKEIGYFERGPLSDEVLELGGSWSAYYYNGFIYSSDIQKGLDVIKITGHNGVDSANRVKQDILNVQTQPHYRE